MRSRDARRTYASQAQEGTRDPGARADGSHLACAGHPEISCSGRISRSSQVARRCCREHRTLSAWDARGALHPPMSGTPPEPRCASALARPANPDRRGRSAPPARIPSRRRVTRAGSARATYRERASHLARLRPVENHASTRGGAPKGCPCLAGTAGGFAHRRRQLSRRTLPSPARRSSPLARRSIRGG